jgi:hypothetical protein
MDSKPGCSFWEDSLSPVWEAEVIKNLQASFGMEDCSVEVERVIIPKARITDLSASNPSKEPSVSGTCSPPNEDTLE